MILPYIDYADVVFDKACSRDLEKLQTLKNLCPKVCAYRDRLFNTVQSHKLSYVLFLHDSGKAHKLNFMFKRFLGGNC